MNSQKPQAGTVLPLFSAISVKSGEQVRFAEPSGRWQLLVIYRGRHCGRCKRYLNRLEHMQGAWVEAGFEINTISADSREKARLDIDEFGWSFPVACELEESDMKKLGLYISDPMSPDEADGRFAEPAIFCLRPDGTVQIAALSNGPSARPDLAELLDGMIFTIEKDRPVRGTVV